MRFYVNGNGFVVETTSGPTLVEHGSIYNAPANWTPIPDSHLLFPMDAAAQAALQASVNAQIALSGPVPPPGLVELSTAIPIFAP